MGIHGNTLANTVVKALVNSQVNTVVNTLVNTHVNAYVNTQGSCAETAVKPNKSPITPPLNLLITRRVVL